MNQFADKFGGNGSSGNPVPKLRASLRGTHGAVSGANERLPAELTIAPGSDLQKDERMADSLKCQQAIKAGLAPAGEFCPKCPKKSGDCLRKAGLWKAATAEALQAAPRSRSDALQSESSGADAISRHQDDVQSNTSRKAPTRWVLSHQHSSPLTC